MDQLEQDLRAELARQVAAPPPVAGLADRAVQRGRRVRRTRAAASVAAVVTVAAAVGATVLAAPAQRSGQVAGASLSGPPRVPVVVRQDVGEVLDWPGGQRRSRLLGEPPQPVAVVPSGLLLLDGTALRLLGPDDAQPRTVFDGVAPASGAVAVSADGARAVVVGPGGLLQELSLPAGRVLRRVTLGEPLVRAGEPVLAAAYSGDIVLLTAGEGEDRRALLWEPGDDAVIAELDGYTAAVGGAPGRGAFTVEGDDRCRVEVAELRTGGRTWRLCREQLVGFSPGGRWLLAIDAVGTGLVVHDARDGDVRRRYDAPRGVRAYAWESDDTLLHTTVDGEGRTLVVRCSVRSGSCRTAASFPYDDRIPEPVPPALG